MRTYEIFNMGDHVSVKTNYDRNEFRLVEHEGDSGIVVHSEYLLESDFELVVVQFDDGQFEYDSKLLEFNE